jgi:glycosyltransferase involved in cell wall biosynthesis
VKIALYNLTTTTQAGGIETFNREMARALAKKGHTVHIYGGKSPVPYDTPPGVTTYLYPYIRRERVPNLGSRFIKLVERLSFGVMAFRDLIRRQYDYLYVSKPFDIPVALLASRYLKAKVIFGSGGTEFFPGYGYLVKKVEHFFACSGFNASQIEQYCGVRPEILPNGVNTELFRPMDPDGELLQRLHIRGTENVIVSACRLVGWKGIQYAIRAAARLIREGYGIKYVIIGDGKYRSELAALAKTLGVENSVFFLGTVMNSELPRYYSIAGAAVFPSVGIEAFGIAIAEAMACGVPTISTGVGGIPEVVAEGTGLLVPPRDEAALSEAMKTLISDAALREAMSAGGRRRIVERFSWDVIVEMFEHSLKNTPKTEEAGRDRQ